MIALYAALLLLRTAVLAHVALYPVTCVPMIVWLHVSLHCLLIHYLSIYNVSVKPPCVRNGGTALHSAAKLPRAEGRERRREGNVGSGEVKVSNLLRHLWDTLDN